VRVNLRRTFALGAVGLLAPGILGGCGFSYATDRINNVTAAANYRGATVEILNAAIVSRKPNAGTFVAAFANNDQSKTVTLTNVAGDGTTVGGVTASALPIPANGFVNLAAQGGIPLSGTFSAGQYVSLTFTFDDGGTTTLEVPVFNDSGQWSGLDHATQAPSSTPSGSANASASGSASASPSGSPSA
jgi:copper(I)-binding protein